MRDLSTGSERVFASHGSISASVGSLWPQIAPDGRRVAYRVVGNSGGHYVLDIVTSEIRRLASLQDFQLGSDWSSDGRRVLGECPPPAFGICDMDADTGRITTIMRHPHDQLLYPSWSPDGRWVVFGRRKPGGRSSIWAARVDAERRLAPETTWVRLSPAGADCQRPRLSLDRSTLYYVAGAEGVRRLIRQTVDPATLAPLGDAAPAVSIPLEVMVVTGGFGPYPLIIPTERGVFFSTNAQRGNLFISPLQ